MYDLKDKDMLSGIRELKAMHVEYVRMLHRRLALWRFMAFMAVPLISAIAVLITERADRVKEAEQLKTLLSACMDDKAGAYSLLDEDGGSTDYMCYSVITGTRREVKK